MCGGGSVSYPAPSQSQQDLEKEQLSLLQDQKQQMNALQPLLADQYGYQPVYSKNPLYNQFAEAQGRYANAADGSAEKNQALADMQRIQSDAGWSRGENLITGYEKTPERAAQDAALAPLKQQALELAKSQMDWQQKAYNGQLPVSDTLVQQKALDFAKLKEQLGQNGDVIMGDEPGSAVAKSTSGTQALTEFNKRYQALEDEERRGIMTQMNGSQNASVGTVAGGQQLQMNGVPYSPYSSLMGGYNTAMQPYLQQQQGMFQSDMFNAQSQNSRLTGLMGLGGQLGSSGLMYAALA